MNDGTLNLARHADGGRGWPVTLGDDLWTDRAPPLTMTLDRDLTTANRARQDRDWARWMRRRDGDDPVPGLRLLTADWIVVGVHLSSSFWVELGLSGFNHADRAPDVSPA